MNNSDKGRPIATTAVRVAADVRLRQEYFGGLVYDRRNGNILEIDKEAFCTLLLMQGVSVNLREIPALLTQNKITKNQQSHIDAVLQELIDLRIIEESDHAPFSPRLGIEPPTPDRQRNWLAAPETVHWAVTYRCAEQCPDCYARRLTADPSELDTKNALKLIGKIAGWGVFQLAIGGGEPFTRHDLPQLVQHAAELGLAVHVTTGKLHVEPALLADLSQGMKMMQMGIRTEDLFGFASKETVLQIRRFFEAVQIAGITPGANLILTKTSIKYLARQINRLVRIGFRRITLLRYKPPPAPERWETELPTPEQLMQLPARINRIAEQYPWLHLRVDCALSFVQRHLPPKQAARLGIKGCVAGERILAVAPDGSAYPCSQLVHPQHAAGNLLETDPQQLWDDARAMRRYRFFRAKKTFAHSWCGVCLQRDACGGCRVFAHDALGGDPGCPEPVLPPLTQLGKTGRVLDLAAYLQKHGSISVAEYMERFGVGQKTALKELNTSLQAVNTTDKPARKKTDRFVSSNKKPAQFIQDTIGYTSAGFPYATDGEIENWLDESSDASSDYPAWLRQRSR